MFANPRPVQTIKVTKRGAEAKQQKLDITRRQVKHSALSITRAG